jgi:L-lactate dehydrogenase
MHSRLFSEIVLIDVNKEKAHGEAADRMHGVPFNAPMDIYAGDYSDISDASLAIITAGANQREGETRIDLVHRNVRVFSSIVDDIIRSGFSGILLVVTNPVDVLTYVTLARSAFPVNRVIGSGTVLDTARLKQLVGDKLGVDSRNVHTFIIGEHGDSEVAVWSSANVSGVDLSCFCRDCAKNCDISAFGGIFENVRDAAYKIIAAKGATCYAIAESVKKIASAIVRDEHTILPVSTLVDGHYGIEGVCMGLPCIVGRRGIEQVLEIPLNEDEESKLRASARALKSVIDQLEVKI